MLILPAVPPSSKIGQALPEDMFAASPSASGSTAAFRVQVGLPASQSSGQSKLGQLSSFTQQNQASSSFRAPQAMAGFGAFGNAQQSTEVCSSS